MNASKVSLRGHCRRLVGAFALGLVVGLTPVASASAEQVDQTEVKRALASVLSGLKKGGSPASPGTRSGATTDAAPAPADVGRFTRDPAVSRQVEAIFVTGLEAINPDIAGQMAQSFAGNDIFAMMAAPMADLGLSSTDTADAMAVFMISGWQGAHSDTSTPGPAEIAAVQGQMRSVLAATPDFAAAPDADKQKMAEGLLLQAMFYDAMTSQAQNDPALKTKVAGDIREGFKAIMQADPLALQLGPSGFSTE